MAGTLLACLCNTPTTRSLAPHITDLLNNRSQEVLLATSLSPHYSDNYENPQSGYRPLGRIGEILHEGFDNNLQVPPVEFSQHEVISIAAHPGDPTTDTFYALYHYMKMDPRHHFVLYLIDFGGRRAYYDQVSRSLQSSRTSYSPSSIGSSSHLMGYETPPVQTSCDQQGTPLNLRSTPSSAADDFSQSYPSAYGVDTSSSGLQQPPDLGAFDISILEAPEQQHSNRFKSLCAAHYISEELMAEAKFIKQGNISLDARLSNHYAMTQVLRALGLMPTSPYNSYRSSAMIKNTTITADKVVKYFGWTPHSFMHKSKWYGVSLNLLRTKQWRGNPPSEGKFQLHLRQCHAFTKVLSRRHRNVQIV